jgi:TM2 domain-containing membrane protein YozV
VKEREKTMKCYMHPEADSVGLCTSCGRAICEQCCIDVQGRLVCRQCLASRVGPLAQQPNANNAFLIEFVAGFFGLLGIGYMYVGRVQDGVIRLVIWIIYNISAYITIVVLSAVLIGLLCIPVQLAIQVGVPLWSASRLKNELTRQ